MSPLTKAFVVLVTILSVLLVALVVPFVAQTQNYQSQIADLKAERDAARQAAEVRSADLDNYRSRLTATEREAEEMRDRLTGQVTTLQGQLQDLQAQLAEEKSGRTIAEASLADLGARAELDAQQLALLQGELNTAREEVVNIRGQNIELRSELQETLAQGRALQSQVRDLTESMAARDQESQRLTALLQQAQAQGFRVDGEGTGATASGVPAPTVQGQVVRVQDVQGETLVQVNIGRSDDLQPGHRLIVARDGNYLGTLVLAEVGDQASVGSVTLLAQGAQVQQGDTVLGGNQF